MIHRLTSKVLLQPWVGQLVLLSLLLMLASCEQETSTIETSVNRTPLTHAIEFSLPDLAGRHHTLREYMERGPVLLFFYATWCPYCQRQIPALKAAHREFGVKGLQVVGINTGLADNEENAQAYALKHRLPYAILFDANAEVSALYHIQAVPKYYLIAQDGQILASTTKFPHKPLATIFEDIEL